MLLNADQEMIRDAVRDFVRTEITPHAARWDKEHHFPKNVHRSEEHTSELQSPCNLVCRLLLEKKKIQTPTGEEWFLRFQRALHLLCIYSNALPPTFHNGVYI